MSNLESTRAILFPGQGSQYQGMADVWTENPISDSVIKEASEIIGYDIVTGSHNENLLSNTDFVQPALVACEVAAYSLLKEVGITFGATAGHSLGEFSALVAADVISLREALQIVNTRGQAMQYASKINPGTMSALIRVDSIDANKLCEDAREDDELLIANFNMPTQFVISGSIPAIKRAESLATERKIRAIRLSVAGAFHSILMEPAVEPIKNILDKIELNSPSLPISENVSGNLVNDPNELRSYLERHVVSPVKWESCIKALGSAGITTFIEAGPGKVLSGFTKRILPDSISINAKSPLSIAAIEL